MERIPFHRPLITGREVEFLEEVFARGQFGGDGHFTGLAESLLRELTGANSVLLTSSCTAALAMSALLLELGPGDDVIMPAWTFPSTASAFMATGARPVFVDIAPDTLCLSLPEVIRAITPRTKAIVVVHYGGGMADIAELIDIAKERKLHVIEDAAQSLLTTQDSRHAGTFGDLGAISFHSTKNIHCGEGGALLVNNPALQERAEWMRNKGTNRRDFLKGKVHQYEWRTVFAPSMPSELSAAFLCAQLETVQEVTETRRAIWVRYDAEIGQHLKKAGINTLSANKTTQHNGHMYPLLMQDSVARKNFCAQLASRGIEVTGHYLPLHRSPAGKGLSSKKLPITDHVADGIVRLPLWPGLSSQAVDRIIDAVRDTTAIQRIKTR